ncbi:MAG: UDP-N-acetylglucosamine--N-acetylmuramyl-(pentapeptide) pyrophosphoryl-undecaprenol N-acetylglucosamine transferase [Planctomycetes bacterium]|nr:UDP-N-acetylglucosamine--N-acetylmuramyl-(pentapeptide) pyrophosphoryl-undecaprenol N-acetylglucosamine transferase [Planctomycetota bacterium]
MNAPFFVFAGGGTGGHLYPGLAVAEMLKHLSPTAAVTFLTSSRPLDRELLDKTIYQQTPQSVRPFSSRPWHWLGFWRAWRESVRQARELYSKRRPEAVLGLGGFAAGPGVVAARELGIRTAILNPDAVPGRANRYLAPRADMVVLQWDVSRVHFPERANCRPLGCPIRAAFTSAQRASGATIKGVPVLEALWDTGEASRSVGGRRALGLAPNRPVLLVTGASQGARTVNQATAAIWPKFSASHPDWQLLHLTGNADADEIRRAYREAGIAESSARVLPFTHEMWHAIAAADVVVSRAGASTLAELTALGKPSILLPYPFHRDRHQHANAQVLVDAGAAMLVEDTKETTTTARPLLAALERLADRERRQTMAEAALKIARPHAAESVARWMLGESTEPVLRQSTEPANVAACR